MFSALVASMLCALVQSTILLMFYLAGFVQVSHCPLKDQGSYQCTVYNWNYRNVHIVNYRKLQVTVEANCNFSQCDVSIKFFLNYYLSVERLAFVWTNLQCHFKTYLSASNFHEYASNHTF